MLNKLKKNNKKGFTLVELIVVLVILAILAALLIPALTGYIDKAREKQIVAETRQVVMAAQTLVDEAYGKDANWNVTSIKMDTNPSKTDIAKLAEVNASNITSITVTNTVITGVVYTDNTRTCTYKRDISSDPTTKGTYEISN